MYSEKELQRTIVNSVKIIKYGQIMSDIERYCKKCKHAVKEVLVLAAALPFHWINIVKLINTI